MFMSSYFPIPNNIDLNSEKGLIIKSSIKVFNYPNNASLKALNKAKKEDIFFSLYCLIKDQWVKVFDQLCEYGSFKEFTKETLDIPKKTLAVIVPSKDCKNESKTDLLPKPYSLRIDKAPINERASYNFSINGVSSCYQGELPFELSVKGSSFFSNDILRLDISDEDKCFLKLMNISRNAKQKGEHTLKIINSEKGEILKSFKVKTNTFDAYYLPIKKNIVKNKTLILTCSTASFIPIFISVRFKNKKFEINVEHTHPPHELFLGAERFKMLNKLKSNWLD